MLGIKSRWVRIFLDRAYQSHVAVREKTKLESILITEKEVVSESDVSFSRTVPVWGKEGDYVSYWQDVPFGPHKEFTHAEPIIKHRPVYETVGRQPTDQELDTMKVLYRMHTNPRHRQQLLTELAASGYDDLVTLLSKEETAATPLVGRG